MFFCGSFWLICCIVVVFVEGFFLGILVVGGDDKVVVFLLSCVDVGEGIRLGENSWFVCRK